MSSPTSVPEMPPPAAPESPALSHLERVTNIFMAPSKTFIDIRRNASWWVPWLLLSIVQLVFIVGFDQKVGWDTYMEQQIAKNPSAQARLDAMQPAQRERMLELQAKGARYFGYATPIVTLIFMVVIAAILMAIFNFGFGAEIPFKQSMATWGYAGLPLAISGLLAIITVYATSAPETFNLNNPVATNPGYFLDPKNSRLLYWLASSLDIFAIWVIVLLGIGYSTVSNNKVKCGAAIAVFVVLYLIFKGVGSIRA